MRFSQAVNLSEYREQIGQIPYGKRLPTALYVHRVGLASLEGSLGAMLDQVVARYEVAAEFNLVKFRTDELKVSFLAYPDFESDPHPALRHAVAIDLATGKARHTDYGGNANPPILHRKETFLPAEHPLRGRFEALTRAEEAAGLYETNETIGFRLNWEKLLAAKGLVIRGHELLKAESGKRNTESGSTPHPACGHLFPSEEKGGVMVERHKTAMTRYDLSKPVKTLLEYGMLKEGMTFFDYGCGQGSDVRGLQALGHQAEGWDPVHRPEVARREADVVNLGYVLNVIEDAAERVEALVDIKRVSDIYDLVYNEFIDFALENDLAISWHAKSHWLQDDRSPTQRALAEAYTDSDLMQVLRMRNPQTIAELAQDRKSVV